MGRIFNHFKSILGVYDHLFSSRLLSDTSSLHSCAPDQVVFDTGGVYTSSVASRVYLLFGIPSSVPRGFLELFRNKCVGSTVVDCHILCKPYTIDWGSHEMRARMAAWSEFSKEHEGGVDVFSYYNHKDDMDTRARLIESTKLFEFYDLNNHRAVANVVYWLRVWGPSTFDGVSDLNESCRGIIGLANTLGFRVVSDDLRVRGWLRELSPFSRVEGNKRDALPERMVVDDIIAHSDVQHQGPFGTDGTVLGLDVLCGLPALYHFRREPDSPEVWLVAGKTGSGKSYWGKDKIIQFMGLGYQVCVADYEGDEYTPLADYMRGVKPGSVEVIDMSPGSGVYFDPSIIAEPTGAKELDSRAKADAESFITAIFVTLIAENGDISVEAHRVLQMAIERMYDCVGVTDDPSTWGNSRRASLRGVYDELSVMVEFGEFANGVDDAKHAAAVQMHDALAVHFEAGESSVFRKSINIDSLYGAELVVFSFGMRGRDPGSVGKRLLAVKQLCVAYVNNLLSNYGKYVRHTFNVKIWEEFQRWGRQAGSGTVILDSVTGGRKRGNIDFILTNDLQALMADDGVVGALRQNITAYALGKLDPTVQDIFMDNFKLRVLAGDLERVGQGKGAYNHSFCVYISNINMCTVVRTELSNVIVESGIFNTGVRS